MSLIFRCFARNIGKKILKKAEVVAEPEPQKDITLEWMADRNVHIEKLPKNLLSEAKSLFSGYPSKKIRDWGYKLAQYYSEVNGQEKPRDITELQPFVTSVELLEKKTEAAHSKVFYKLPKELTGKDTPSSPTALFTTKGVDSEFKYQSEHAIGYAYKRMPSTYAAAYRILHEIKHRMPEFIPENCLDFGAGTGGCSWAALENFPDLQVVSVEPSKEMRTIGKKLSKKQPSIQWAESLANLPGISDKKGVFDIVICGYVLSEVENAVTRNLILDALWQRTGKVLVFIEPGTPKGFRLIYSIRDWALKTMNRNEVNVIAPCPHEGICPLAVHAKSWCHFSQFTAKYPSEVISRVDGEFDSENEKYSYIALKRGNVPRYYSAESSLNLAEESFLWPRLVRPTIRRTRHVTFDVCREGEIERIVLSKGKTEKKIYRMIRKAHWGDLWPYKNTEKDRLMENKKPKKPKGSKKPDAPEMPEAPKPTKKSKMIKKLRNLKRPPTA